MKRAVAIKKALKIAETLHSVCGLIGTPGTEHEAVRVKRAWLFGSTVKGKDEPNDVDILLEISTVGRRYWTNQGRGRNLDWPQYFGAKLDKEYRRSYGMCEPIRAAKEAKKFIRGGMKMVRLHDLDWDGNFGDIAETKVLIYPRNDLALRGVL